MSSHDLAALGAQLSQQGFVVLEGLLEPDLLAELRSVLADLFARERETRTIRVTAPPVPRMRRSAPTLPSHTR